MNTKKTAPTGASTVGADLQRQRDYVKALEDQQFEYGLVLAGAFVKGMRDIGYKSTAYALNELNDNSIQAGAKTIHVAFGYLPANKVQKKPDMLAIIDDGHGMDPGMIRASVIWGGTHRQNDRTGFGRYGYGLPSACVSIGMRYSVFSKVEGSEWHNVTIDLDDIDEHFRKASGPVRVKEAEKSNPPSWVLDYVEKHYKQLRSGTVVLIEKIDRLDHATTQKLRGDLLEDFGTTYRNFLSQISMAVDGVAVEPTDPLFLTEGFLFYDVDSERPEALPPLEIEVKDRDKKEALGTIKVRFSYMSPTFLRVPEDKAKVKGGKNNVRFNIRKANNGIIMLRAGRQIDVVSAKCPWTTFQNNDRYVGVEVDFPPALDEEFSITTSKQQVVLRQRIWDILEENGVYRSIEAMRSRYAKDAAELKAKAKEQEKEGKRPSEAAMEKAQPHFAQPQIPPSSEQVAKSEENLDREAEKIAEQVKIPTAEAKKILEAKAKTNPYVVEFTDSPGAPFYRMEQRGGQRVLYINKAHAFFTELYASSESSSHVRYALEALLFVMGDCELRGNTERQLFYGQERTYWSINLETTLKVLEEWNSSADLSHSIAETAEAADLAVQRKRSA